MRRTTRNQIGVLFLWGVSNLSLAVGQAREVCTRIQAHLSNCSSKTWVHADSQLQGLASVLHLQLYSWAFSSLLPVLNCCEFVCVILPLGVTSVSPLPASFFFLWNHSSPACAFLSHRTPLQFSRLRCQGKLDSFHVWVHSSTRIGSDIGGGQPSCVC